jgi:hypothetical protein
MGCSGHAVAWLVEALDYKSDLILNEGIRFNLSNRSSRALLLKLPQPPTEISVWKLPGGKEWQARKFDNLTVICKQTFYELYDSRCLTALWAFMA